jgi:hypothetical protein
MLIAFLCFFWIGHANSCVSRQISGCIRVNKQIFSAFSASEGWDVQGMQFIHWHDVGLTNGLEAAI